MHISFRSFLLLNILFLMTSYCLSEESKSLDIGIGYGTTYGMLGINLGYNAHNNLVLFAGVGYEIIPNYNYWSCGLRYYLINYKYPIRPRISLHYGINSEIEYTKVAHNGVVLGRYNELDEGITIGAGFRSILSSAKSFGIDLDVYYALQSNNTPLYQSNFYDLKKFRDKSQITFSLGIRYEFDLY